MNHPDNSVFKLGSLINILDRDTSDLAEEFKAKHANYFSTEGC